MISTIPSDSSHLIAYVMTHNKMNQLQAMKWLDKRVPNWRTEEPKMPNYVESKSSEQYELLDDEIVVDNFAGGGGAGEGVRMALGRSADIAINHDPTAIDMYRLNHPETKVFCESVWDVDVKKICSGRPVGFGWFSPDCTHFSKAKGDKPVDQKIRGLAWVVIRWAICSDMRVFHLENVEEFTTWGPLKKIDGKWKPDPQKKGETFEAFFKVLTTGLSPYHPAWPEVCNALKIEDNIEAKMKLRAGLGYKVEYKVLSACNYGAGTTRARFFMIARKDGEKNIWPEPTHGDGLIPYVTASDCIDWSLPVKSIFGRKKPLAEKTLARIAKGIKRFVIDCEDPFIVPREAMIPFITECANNSIQCNTPINEFLVTSHIVKLRNGNVGQSMEEPLHTITSGGNHFGEVRAYLIAYYGTDNMQSLDTPLNTITTRDRFALVVVKGQAYTIADIGLRMLQPHELFKAQSFRDDYIIDHDSSGKKLSKKNQVAKVGNSVPPLLAKALVQANLCQQRDEIMAA